jgi:hypothetical protein
MARNGSPAFARTQAHGKCDPPRRGNSHNILKKYSRIQRGGSCLIMCVGRTLLVVAFAVSSVFVSTLSIAVAQDTTVSCGDWFEPKTYQDAIVAQADPRNDKPAVIFGKPYDAPSMRIRFIDGATGLPLRNLYDGVITVSYSWRWLEYPYPEHAWGAWSDAADQLKCKPDIDGWFQTPGHKVMPRGWYEGKYTRFPWPHRPSFNGIGIAANTGYFARVALKPGDLHKFTKFDLTVRVFDGWRTELMWDPKQKETQTRVNP